MKNYIEYFGEGKKVKTFSGEEKLVNIPYPSYLSLFLGALYGRPYIKNLSKIFTGNTQIPASDNSNDTYNKYDTVINNRSLLDSTNSNRDIVNTPITFKGS